MIQVPFEASTIYHLYNRGNNRESIFLQTDNYTYFLTLTKKYLIPIADIYCYCLLPNHFHIVLRIKDSQELPCQFQKGEKKLHQPFSNLFNAYSKAINKQNNRRGSLFQEHLKRKIITDTHYLIQVILYVHLNPIKHQISSSFELYTHSSYRSLLSNRRTLLQRKLVVKLFDSHDNFRHVHQQQKIRLKLIQDIIDEDV